MLKWTNEICPLCEQLVEGSPWISISPNLYNYRILWIISLVSSNRLYQTSLVHSKCWWRSIVVYMTSSGHKLARPPPRALIFRIKLRAPSGISTTHITDIRIVIVLLMIQGKCAAHLNWGPKFNTWYTLLNFNVKIYRQSPAQELGHHHHLHP